MEFDLIKDLSCITEIKESLLQNLIKYSNLIISHDIVETLCNKEKITKIDIGIGYLYITNDNSIIKYKFIPSEKLEKTVIDSYNHKNELSIKIENSLSEKINNSYKELF